MRWILYIHLRMFEVTKEILNAHNNYEIFKLVVYGPEGAGKSSFCVQLLAELYGKKEWVEVEDPTTGKRYKSYEVVEPDWYAWRDHMVWTPEMFEQKMLKAAQSGKQQLCLVWNDAGAWAHKNRRFTEWAMRMSESSQMWRRWFAGIVLNTPDPRNLLSFLRSYSWKVGRVSRVDASTKRYIRIYQNDIYPDLQKIVTRIFIHEDWFDLMLPDQVFHDFNSVDRKYALLLHKRQMEARQEGGELEAIADQLQQEIQKAEPE